MTRLASVLKALGIGLFAGSLVVCPGSPAAAQDASADSPAHISVVDGRAVLERDGQPDSSPLSMPLLAGDRIRTENGRVEVLFTDGSTLHLDASTVVDFQSDEVVRLLDGRIRVNVAGPNRGVSYRIDAPGGWVQISAPGEYRVAVIRQGDGRDVQVELAVFRGAAELLNEDGQTSLRAGERAFARAGAAPSYAYVFNSAAWDSFDRWSDDRRRDRAGVSAQYLPDNVRPYASTFDNYGSWRYETSYGYVWYPTVHAGWRPYYHGRWASLRPFGWTWIASDPWGWPTHHYGRWGFSAGLWFWIPGRRWGPAWVSWAYAPGYVSWCPLGWDNRPVFNILSVNIYGGRRYDPWRAWTVVPHRRFGTGFVNANVILGDRLDPRTRSTFAVRDRGPDSGGYAVPRASSPIYVAGGRRGTYSGQTTSLGYGDGARASERGRITSGGSPGAPRSSADDAAAAFRGRRPQNSNPAGPGFPPAARAPRDSAVVRDRAPATRGDSRAEPGRSSEDVSNDRRAVPRARSNNDGVESSQGPASRLDVPGYRRAPAAPSRPYGGETNASPSYSTPQNSAPSRRYGSDRSEDRAPSYTPYSATPGRAVPRHYGTEPSQPEPQRAPDRGGSNPGAYDRRSAPRQAPEYNPPPTPQNGGERRAPAAPRAAEPSPRQGGGDGGGARSRSGNDSGQGNGGGHARSRGRGGQ
jgi:hypothetical protein